MADSPKQCAFGSCQQRAEWRIIYRDKLTPRQDSVADVCSGHSLNWPTRAAGSALRRTPLPTVANVGGFRCDIRPCGGKAQFMVSFEKTVGKYRMPGTAQVCPRHENEWPSGSWGTKLSSVRIRGTGGTLPGAIKMPKQKPKGDS